jgi:hypothetical protein
MQRVKLSDMPILWIKRLAPHVVMASAIAFWVGMTAAVAQTRVDLELVIAVDVSLSMDLDEQRLQRDGYVAAFRDSEVQKAVVSGPHGRIAVTYVEWAGELSQHVVIPWTLIDGPEAANAFAERLESFPISRYRMTSISGALAFSGRLFETSGFSGIRRVIDISGDGPNNSGGPVTVIRDELVRKGIVINGLPIVLKTSMPASLFDIPNLDRYYADCVIGGTGAFMLAIRDKAEFAPAIRRKLLLEIAALAPSAELIRVQAPGDERPTNCLIGEQLWEQYIRGRFAN